MRRDVVMKLLGGRRVVTQSPSRSPPPPPRSFGAGRSPIEDPSVGGSTRASRPARARGWCPRTATRPMEGIQRGVPARDDCVFAQLVHAMRCERRISERDGTRTPPLGSSQIGRELAAREKVRVSASVHAASNGVRPESESSTSDANASGASVLPGTLDGGLDRRGGSRGTRVRRSAEKPSPCGRGAVGRGSTTTNRDVGNGLPAEGIVASNRALRHGDKAAKGAFTGIGGPTLRSRTKGVLGRSSYRIRAFENVGARVPSIPSTGPLSALGV